MMAFACGHGRRTDTDRSDMRLVETGQNVLSEMVDVGCGHAPKVKRIRKHFAEGPYRVGMNKCSKENAKQLVTDTMRPNSSNLYMLACSSIAQPEHQIRCPPLPELPSEYPSKRSSRTLPPRSP